LNGRASTGSNGCTSRKILNNTRQRQKSLPPLWASSSEDEIETETDTDDDLDAMETDAETDTDDDLDAFMEELAEEVETEKKEEAKDTSHFIEGKRAVGIGGNAGFVYDVNALKRNLVQESVRGCKEEILVLLGDGRQSHATKDSKKSSNNDQRVVVSPRWKRDQDDLIEERLSALVQVCFSMMLFFCTQVCQKAVILNFTCVYRKGQPGIDYHRFQSS